MSKAQIKIIKGDITKQKVDVIVNAAKKNFLGSRGVDGAIHRAAGPNLIEDRKAFGSCQIGTVKVTKGYNLPAKYVIHAFSPAYGQERGQEARILKNCYLNSLKEADKLKIKSIAFPCISTGSYCYPKEEAAGIAYKAVKEFLETHPDTSLEEVIFVTYSEADYSIYYDLMVQGGEI